MRRNLSTDEDDVARHRLAGPQISTETLISKGVFLAIFAGISFAMDSFFILYIVIAGMVVVTLVQLFRRRSLVPLVANGTDYSDEYRIEGNMVTVEKEDKLITEPLANYVSVRWREETALRGVMSTHRHRKTDVFQILELVHGTDDARNVNLYTSQEMAGMRSRWQDAARSCNLPALRDLGDGNIVRRAPEDLGKPLGELVRLGVVKTGFRPNGSLPAGTRWSNLDGVLKARLRKAVTPYIVFAVPILLFAAFVGFMVPAELTNTLLAFAALLIGLALLLSISIWVRVTPERLAVGWRLGPLPLWGRSVALETIEDILIGQGLLSWDTVLIESDSTTLKLGPLSNENAVWLSDFLIAAVATVPDRSTHG